MLARTIIGIIHSKPIEESSRTRWAEKVTDQTRQHKVFVIDNFSHRCMFEPKFCRIYKERIS